MSPQRIGIIHPGAMGISLAAAAQNSGHQVYWASQGRSPQTRDRAVKFGLHDTDTVAKLCETCDVIVSVCPPHAAEDVALHVVRYGYQGHYLDCNAISPQRAVQIGLTMSDVGMTFTDGGIIGGPAWQPKKTWLYLAGPQAETAIAWFAAGPLETTIVGDTIGKASALKMCYAAYTKGTTALICATLAAAHHLGVQDALFEQWNRDDADFAAQAGQRVQQVTAKAWRFAGEMEEIAATFNDVGVPDGFHQAAAIVYQRLAHFKDVPTAPALEGVVAALMHPTDEPSR